MSVEIHNSLIAIRWAGSSCELADRASGRLWSDLPYSYSIRLEARPAPTRLEPREIRAHVRKSDAGPVLVVRAHYERAISVTHTLRIAPRRAQVREVISVRNNSDRALRIHDLAIGFRKRIDGSSRLRLVAVPYRRNVDGKLHDYSMEDLLAGRFSNSNVGHDFAVARERLCDDDRLRSEGWILTDGRRSLLIEKYDEQMVEYSVAAVELATGGADGPQALRPGPPDGGGQAQGSPASGGQALRYGGASLCLYREPRAAAVIEPGQSVRFGETLYTIVPGGWYEAYLEFRRHMDKRGHGLPRDYDPPINWNELYDIGWYHSDREKLFQHYTLPALHREAAKARDIGCTLLYLDPGWEICEGTTLWDRERLGQVGDLVETLKKEYGLDLGYRTIGRVYRDEFPNSWYKSRSPRQRRYVRLVVGESRINFWEVCTENRAWLKEKLRRILAITSQGVKFMMFDEFDWRGPCFDGRHDHPTPSTPEGHARAIYWLIQQARRRRPDLLVEAHDPVWPWACRYLPTYWQQGFGLRSHSAAMTLKRERLRPSGLGGNRYQENWGFEFMWNPIEDLKSGKALALYYYNLAYNIPLYLHITMEGDNDNCLFFWWAASTVRHLGIGGKKGLGGDAENEARFRAYKNAMKRYLALRPYFTRGHFYGIDELTHLHSLPSRQGAVVVVFNLGSRAQRRTVRFRLEDVGLKPGTRLQADAGELRQVGSEVRLKTTIPPVSALVAALEPLEG